MFKKNLISACLLALTFVLAVQVSAQSIEDIDYRNVNISELSEQQIQRISQEIEDRGLSLNEFGQLAMARGGDQSRVEQLIQRVRRLREGGGTGQAGTGLRRDDGSVRQIEDFDDFSNYNFAERDTIPDSLRIFGMELFDRVNRLFRDAEEGSEEARTSFFEPSFNVPTPRDYAVGTGDQLVIDIWGASENTYQLTVSAEGNIRIPNLGPIYVNGLQFDDARDRILNRLTEIYSGLDPNNSQNGNVFAQVSLGNVRSIKVTVMGEVQVPGTFTVSSLSTVFNALYAAGGPNRNGSFREIQIIRDNEIIETFDIYDFLVFGNQDTNIRLRDQDIIKVEPYINRIHVWGEAKRVGYFETRDGETVEDLVTFIAGFTDNAYTRRLTLHRTTPSMQSILDLFYPGDADVELRNGDKLRVGQLLDRYENRVSIQGAVFRPGEYELEQGMTLYDLLQKSDGVREDAFMSRGVIHRLQENLDTETVAFNVQNVIDSPESYDVPLRKDDVVRISSIFDMREEYTVRVSGSVNRPSTFDFRENMTLEDAIFRADGFRDKAAAYRVEVARRVTGSDDRMKVNEIAEIHRFEVDKNLGFNSEDAQFTLMPFDQIYVRTKPNYQVQQTVTITGEVQFPGEYVLSNRRARLSDLIEWAGGLSNYSYPQGASLRRVLEVTEAEREDIREDGDEEQEQMNENGTRVDTIRTSVGIRLEDALDNPHSGADLILEAGDELHIPKELQTVRIEGEVLSPTSVRYRDNRSFRDYIDAAGGVTEAAQRRRAYIVYANGEVDRTRKFLFFRNNPPVEPGATIIIPQAPERRELTPQERVSLASSIASTALLFITLIDRIQN